MKNDKEVSIEEAVEKLPEKQRLAYMKARLYGRTASNPVEMAHIADNIKRIRAGKEPREKMPTDEVVRALDGMMKTLGNVFGSNSAKPTDFR